MSKVFIGDHYTRVEDIPEAVPVDTQSTNDVGVGTDVIPEAETVPQKIVFFDTELPYETSTVGAEHHSQAPGSFHTPDIRISSEIETIAGYPFNLSSKSVINTIRIRGKDLILHFKKDKLVSNRPIMMELQADELRIWEAEYKENYALTLTGRAEKTGVSVLDFDGRQVGVDREYLIKDCGLGKTCVKALSARGENLDITLNDLEYADVCNLSFSGAKTQMHVIDGKFKELALEPSYGDLTLTNCEASHVKCELFGNGTVSKLTCESDIKIVGGGTVYIDKEENISSKMIHGIGEVKVLR